MTKLFLSVILLLCLLNGTINAQDNDRNKAKAQLIATIDSILNGAVTNEEIPGAVIQIKQDGKIIYKHAYGYSQKYDFNHQLLAQSSADEY